MESMEIHEESTESPRGVSTESIVDSPWSPLYFGESLWTPCGLLMESTWSPCGLYVDCRKYSHGLPLKSMESSWSPWKPMGECKVLLLLYQVLPDVIVSNTPHAVIVYY